MSLIDTVRIVTDLGIVKVAIVPLNMRNPRWRLQLRLCSLPIRDLPNVGSGVSLALEANRALHL